MRLRDYFAGLPVMLRSPLSARTVAEQINEAAISPFMPFAWGVVGRVWAGQHLRLRYRGSFPGYNAKPVLAGRILDDHPTGSRLDLTYRAPAWTYGFYCFWYLVLLLVAPLMIIGGQTPDITAGDRAMMIGTLLLLLVAPIAIHAIGTLSSDRDLERLIEFLEEHAEAAPASAPESRR